MKAEAKIVALDVAANIYVVVDDKGNSIGTGTKEVCEVLVHIANAGNTAEVKKSQSPAKGSSNNIHSAITI